MASDAILGPPRNAFYPGREIGRGDTPFTLIFIAVFAVLLTLMENSITNWKCIGLLCERLGSHLQCSKNNLTWCEFCA